MSVMIRGNSLMAKINRRLERAGDPAWKPCAAGCGIWTLGPHECCFHCRMAMAGAFDDPFADEVYAYPRTNELAGRAPAAAEEASLEMRGREGVKRLWDALPRVRIGVASHLPFLGRTRAALTARRGSRAASHPYLQGVALGVALFLLSAFCCMTLIQWYVASYGISEFGR